MYQGSHIDPYLRTIEYEYNINIIGAWDRGSRAWNLHTDESDYDIRICFTRVCGRMPFPQGSYRR